MRKLSVLLSLLVLASMVLTACGGATATEAPAQPEQPATAAPTTAPEATAVPTEAPMQHGTLRVNTGAFPDIIDPQKSSFVNEIGHLNKNYEGLTRFNAKLETVPAAAESWEFNADGTVLTFKLRDGLVYSDGSVLNAQRFQYSITRNIDPTTAGEYAQITDEIAGAPEWRGCGEDVAACDAAKATVTESVKPSHADGAACTGYDDAACTTLTLTLSKPAPYFPTVMALWVTFPAKQENIEAGGETWWLDPEYQIGNGPWILSELEQGVTGKFVSNPNYWAGEPNYDIEYSYITDGAVQFEAYKNNEFDVIASGGEDFASIEADADLKAQHVVYAGSCTIAVMFHQQKEPFTDIKVREAFAYALDRDAWVKDVDSDLSLPTLTWIPPGYPGYKEGETRWGYDPEKARQAITESSYGSVAALPEIDVTFSDSARNRVRHEWLVAKWKEVFGDDLKIKLNPVEPTTYTALTKDIKTAPSVFRLGWCADYPDPQNWLSVYWKTGGFGERIGYSNPDFDALVNAADVELDPAKRADLYQQAQDLLLDDAPVAFMYNTKNHYLVKPWVMGVEPTPQDGLFPGDVDPNTIYIDVASIPQ
jgi:oligopeptide transport system substrate-binding protein